MFYTAAQSRKREETVNTTEDPSVLSLYLSSITDKTDIFCVWSIRRT